MILLIYIIKTILLSGLLFTYYLLVLRNRFYHRFNRLFLLMIPVFSFLLPACHFSWPDFMGTNRGGSPIPLLGVVQGGFEEVFTVYARRQSGNIFSWQLVAILLFTLISCVLLLRLYRTIHYLRLLKINKPSLELPEATLYFVSEKGTPFSFFRSIFWGKEQTLDNEAGRQILKHEIFHVKQFHTLDLLYLEILLIVAWFNPFFYLLRKELKAIHEYEADAYAMTEGDSFSYASLLLANYSGSIHPLTNPFFKNQIKRRIAMIMKNNKNKNSLLGRLMILPLLLVLAGIFSFTFHHPTHLSTNKTTRVVPFKSDSVPADTLTKESLKNFDIAQIATMNVDRTAGLITLTTKNGKKYVEVITSEMIHEWDSINNAEKNLPDTANPNQMVFTKVDVEAEYPGGQQGWYDYLIKNLKYPASAIKNEIQGEVVVEFIVKKSGMVTDIHAISGPAELKEASVNVIKASGHWIPAKQNGKIVESYKRQPINFKLEAK
jgi:TonB family protein